MVEMDHYWSLDGSVWGRCSCISEDFYLKWIFHLNCSLSLFESVQYQQLMRNYFIINDYGTCVNSR